MKVPCFGLPTLLPHTLEPPTPNFSGENSACVLYVRVCMIVSLSGRVTF